MLKWYFVGVWVCVFWIEFGFSVVLLDFCGLGLIWGLGFGFVLWFGCVVLVVRYGVGCGCALGCDLEWFVFDFPICVGVGFWV